MKIRNGFVSNSSSSSFIIGYGVVPNNKQKNLIKTIKKCVKYDWEFKLIKAKDVEDNLKQLDVDKLRLSDDDILLFVEIYNHEGDEIFYNEEDECFNYSIANDISFYSDKQQKIIKILSDGRFFDKTKPYIYRIGACRIG